MYVGVIFDKQTKTVADYTPEASLMRYTICDGEYPADGTDELSVALITLTLRQTGYYKEEDKWTKFMSVMICGAIGDGAAKALEEFGVKVYRNVTGDVADAVEAYKNNKLEEGENTKLPDRQNLFEYWCAQKRPVKLKLEYYAKGMEMFGASLSNKDKAWLYDQCFEVPSRWDMFSYISGVLDYKFDMKRAQKYMKSFLKVWTTFKTQRNADNLDEQNNMLERMRVLAENMQEDFRQEFLNEAFLLAAKDRLILVAEYMMDQKADINYVNKKGISVADYESTMKDLTMQSYLSYYHQHGEKMGPAYAYFFNAEKQTAIDGRSEAEKAGKVFLMYKYKYLPKLADEDGQIFGKNALSVCKDVLKDYGKANLLKKTTKAEELNTFIEEYNWDDGLEVPHFIAVHPNCSKETKEKMYDLVEGSSFYGTKDFENSNDEQWKTLITELHDMLNGKS